MGRKDNVKESREIIIGFVLINIGLISLCLGQRIRGLIVITITFSYFVIKDKKMDE